MRRPRRVAVAGALLLGGLFLALVLLQASSSAREASQGKQALVAAERHLAAGRWPEAEQSLRTARSRFVASGDELDRLGPLVPASKWVPFVRVQVRGTEGFASAGVLLADAALQVTRAGSALLHPPSPDVPMAESLSSLQSVHSALADGLTALDASIAKVAALNGYRLVGPLASARADLVKRLPPARQHVARAEAGLRAFLSFAGARGPRRYLVFSQNPDEVRPTGGFLGTYGVLVSGPGGLRLERYDGIEQWITAPAHAAAARPSDEAPPPFRLVRPSKQNLANVNASLDWPASARLASELWVRGGEAPVDGVLSFTPDFLARLLRVLGPVEIPAFGETVTAANLVERADFHTHRATPGIGSGRKAFVAEAVRLSLERLLSAPASQWRDLGRVAGEGFAAREAMAWSAEEPVETVLHGLGWDGAFVGADGDFVAPSEFEYSAKNGRGLRRTYSHSVVLRADGSARVSTDVVVANTLPPDPVFNLDSLSYVVMYGPRGGVLAPGSGTPPPDAAEPALDGHPAAGGWLRAAPPLGEDRFRVVWDVPRLAARQSDGSLVYRLTWRHLAAHAGDVVQLKVQLPPGWRWQHGEPPSTVPLSAGFSKSWAFEQGES
jgi:Protein of unknown function (DUF4012)